MTTTNRAYLCPNPKQDHKSSFLNTTSKTNCTTQSDLAPSNKKPQEEDLITASLDSVQEILEDPALLDLIQTSPGKGPEKLKDEDDVLDFILNSQFTPTKPAIESSFMLTTVRGKTEQTCGRKKERSNDVATQTAAINSQCKASIEEVFALVMEKLTALEKGIASIKKRISVVPQDPSPKEIPLSDQKDNSLEIKKTSDPITPAAVTIPEGMLMTGSMKTIKLSQRKIQRASALFKDEDEKNLQETNKKASDNFDEELIKILSKKHTFNGNKTKKPFVPPSSIKHKCTPIKKQTKNLAAPLSPSQEEFILSLLDTDTPASNLASKRKVGLAENDAVSKKSKVNPAISTTVIDQRAYTSLKNLITHCDQHKAPALPAEELKLKERSICRTISEAEKYLFKCYCNPSTTDSNTVCTLCSNMGLIGYTQIYTVWFDIVKSSLTIDWVRSHYRLVVWRLGAFDDTVLCLANVVYKLVKYYNQEIVKKAYPSFLYKSVCIDTSHSGIGYHQVLMVTEILSTEQGYEIELTDGRYCIKTPVLKTTEYTNEGLLARLVKEGKVKERGKLHIIGAKIVKENRIEISYNGIGAAVKNEKLGLQKKNWLYKAINTLSQYGGPVQMIDVILLTKTGQSGSKSKSTKNASLKAHFIDSLSEIYPKKANVKAEISIKTFEQYNKLEEGKRYKLFGLIPKTIPKDMQRNGVLYLETTENTRIVECDIESLKSAYESFAKTQKRVADPPSIPEVQFVINKKPIMKILLL
eukprot:TRINITY_DN1380_c0_g1_i1.p1 TRINITY_DN1380_c0_g1~~TRINITY_DN1380_c0_g1_i1.p1  ORF type:complete len:777 (+),score=66.67 TRINITY_DN1380_c0_g1_i1:70-2331(+)